MYRTIGAHLAALKSGGAFAVTALAAVSVLRTAESGRSYRGRWRRSAPSRQPRCDARRVVKPTSAAEIGGTAFALLPDQIATRMLHHVLPAPSPDSCASRRP